MIIVEARSWKRTARNIVVTVVVLVALLVGGGLAYTYYFGPDNSQAADVNPKPAPASSPLRPPKIDPNSPVGVSVQGITSPVAPGDNAGITIKTRPEADCKIAVAYGPAGTPASKDTGLSPRKADEFGIVNWTWTVEKAAAPGKWPVHVDCKYGAKSGKVWGDLVIAKQP